MQNQTLDIIKIAYNNEEFSVKRNSSLKQLLNSKLIKLPMNVWYDLLIKKDGFAPEFMLREILLQKVRDYDTSIGVNEFTLNGINYWFDKATRVSLVNLVNSSEEDVSFILGSEIVTLSKEKASKFLANLEVYASKCFIKTAQMLEEIKHLNTVEDIINYEYIKQYPNKINFV